MDFIEQLNILGHVALAGGFGGVIGWEREMAGKAAGFRTHILVSSAAALLTLLAITASFHYAEIFPQGMLTLDPIRIIQAIVIGVSFIGGGVIIKEESNGDVRNLTTAASILFVAGVGIATALGSLYLAAGLTLMVVIVNKLLYKVEKRAA